MRGGAADAPREQRRRRDPRGPIQPYAENAIRHGPYPPTRRAGRLRVGVGDNGAGRATAGILAAERMRLVERVYGIAASVEVTDPLDEGGAARGTRVEVVIGVG